jgi:hypothetical protein
MQVWPDAVADLREIGRVFKLGGQLALVFSRHSGQRCEGMPNWTPRPGSPTSGSTAQKAQSVATDRSLSHR